ncbi:MAG: formate/nitrite transporter family protein [Jatrophihabitans sp.]|uniref:formate/nitrite transporter family protein n=1 Tax=Jatrophihabitans sp. TaxID=1932789 RepID=UPI003911B17D
MPIPCSDAIDDVCAQAVDKAETVRSPLRYSALAALAGAYVGIAVVLLASVAGPLAAATSPATKLVQGAVFGIALTLVVFAGAELFTGNNMVMLIGWLRGGVSAGAALMVNLASLVGNFVGSVALAAVVHSSGVLDTAPPGEKPAGEGMITTLVTNKMHATDGQLFWRALLCNALVCLGLWMAIRTRSDGAKLAVLFWALLAFIASGFEHSVANMTIFSLAIFNNAANWSDLAHNLLLTVPGNVVGGALVVGLPYAFSARPKRPVPAAVKPSPAGVREPASALA